MRLSLLLPVGFLLLACGGKPKALGEQEHSIRFVRSLTPQQTQAVVKKNPELQKAMADFKPVVTTSYYDFRGIEIIIIKATLPSADAAFGFFSALTADPRNVFSTENITAHYKPPFVGAVRGKETAVAFSINQSSFYSPYVKDEVMRLVASAPSAEISYHRALLPEQNRFKDSEFYLPHKALGDYEIVNIYGARYLSKTNIARVYIGRHTQDEHPRMIRDAYFAKLARKGVTVTAVPDRIGTKDGGSYWKNANGGYDAFLSYRWLAIYFENFADSILIENLIQATFTNMFKIRDLALEQESAKHKK